MYVPWDCLPPTYITGLQPTNSEKFIPTLSQSHTLNPEFFCICFTYIPTLCLDSLFFLLFILKLSILNFEARNCVQANYLCQFFLIYIFQSFLFSVSVCLSLPLFLSVWLSRLFLSLSLSLSIYIYIYIYIYISLSVDICLFLHIYIYKYLLSLCLHLSVCLSVYIYSK